MGKKETEDIEENYRRHDEDEDYETESEYINNNLQLVQKEIEPHNHDNFKIINRNVQLGNYSTGGHMYQLCLLSYERSITYTLTQKQKVPKSYYDTYEVIDLTEEELEKIDWNDHEKVKNLPRKTVTAEIKKNKYYEENLYKNSKGQIVKRMDEVEFIPFISEHIRDSPLERSSFHAVSSNSVDGFLRKNRRTIAREVNSKSQDSVEAGKPIIMQKGRNDYFNSGGSW